MPPKSKVFSLPPALKEWLDAELVRRGFSDYAQLAVDLKARGGDVSKSALHRYGSPFERSLARVKLATEQAVALVDAAPDDEDKLGGAVIRIAQEKILNLLMELDVDEQEVDITKLLKSAAEVARASTGSKKWSLQARRELQEQARLALLAEQEERFKALGAAGEVDAATLAKVIQAAYGL